MRTTCWSKLVIATLAYADGYPSAHAIICNPTEKRVASKIIKRACCIIKSNCTIKNNSKPSI